MGSSCTSCNCNKDGNEPSELLTVDNKVFYFLLFHLISIILVWESQSQQSWFGIYHNIIYYELIKFFKKLKLYCLFILRESDFNHEYRMYSREI